MLVSRRSIYGPIRKREDKLSAGFESWSGQRGQFQWAAAATLEFLSYSDFHYLKGLWQQQQQQLKAIRPFFRLGMSLKEAAVAAFSSLAAIAHTVLSFLSRLATTKAFGRGAYRSHHKQREWFPRREL